jgi:putative tricarboxylic transport membrane protein
MIFPFLKESSMKKYEAISSLAWMAVGIFFLMGSIGMGLGSLRKPGPGFFPLVMAGCLISSSLIHFVSSLIKRKQCELGTGKSFWPGNDGIKRILLTYIFLFGFVLILNDLGFVLSTFLFVFVSLRFVETQKWRTVLLIGSLTAILSYTIFQFLLNAGLPTGVLGF